MKEPKKAELGAIASDCDSDNIQLEILVNELARQLDRNRDLRGRSIDCRYKIRDLRAVFDNSRRLLQDVLAPKTIESPKQFFEFTQSVADMNVELAAALNEFAPDFCYFDRYESVWGFYFDKDSFDEAVREGSVVKASQVPDYAARVSDHGNITLYSVKAVEFWGVV